MDSGRERRCVSKIHILKVFQYRTHGNTHNGDICHFIYSSRAQDLCAQKLMCCLICDQLCDKGSSIRIIMSLVIGHSQSGDHIIAGSFSLRFCQTGTSAVQTRQLHHTCSQNTRIGFVFTCKDLGQCSSFHISGGSHGRPFLGACHAIGYESAVTGSIDIRQIGLQLCIYFNRSLEHIQTGIFEEICVRTDTCRADQKLTGKCACAGTHTADSLCAQNSLCLGTGDHTDTFISQMFLYVICHFSVQNLRKHLRSKIDHGNGDTFCLQILSSFQTDKSGADHNGLFHMVFFYIRTDSYSIIRGTHFKYALLVHAFYRKLCRRSTNSDHKTVITVVFCLSRSQILCLYCLCFTVHTNGFSSGQYFHTGKSREFLRCIHYQFFSLFDQPAYIVGKSASRIRDVCAFGDQCYFCAAVFSFQFCRSFGSGCYTADDYYLHLCSSIL